jgi:hypothetical protein
MSNDVKDLRSTIVPRSDQTNADDLVTGPKTIRVTDVTIGSSAEQPVSVHYEGGDGRPFKPCKTMRRVLICGWGPDGNDWIGRSMTLYHDAKVRFGGDEVGGIRISHMTDIDRDIEVRLTATRGKKALHVIKRLDSPLAGMLTDIENSPNAAALKDNFGASYKHMKGNEPARVQLKAAYDKRLAALTTVPPKTLQQYAEDIDNAADITIAQNTLDEAKTKLTADEVDTLQKNFDMAWKA